MRLKGNSSLMGLRMAGSGAASQTDDTGNQRIGGGGDLSADTPEGLPWLIRLDKSIDDKNITA